MKIDGGQVLGGGPAGFPLYADPIGYAASQKRLLEDVRPKRLYAGHRFRLNDGTLLESVVDGPRVEQALRDSLALHDQLTEIARTIGGDLNEPTALSLRPVAEALGLPEQPLSWPPSIFVTMHGYRKLAAAATA